MTRTWCRLIKSFGVCYKSHILCKVTKCNSYTDKLCYSESENYHAGESNGIHMKKKSKGIPMGTNFEYHLESIYKCYKNELPVTIICKMRTFSAKS